MQWITMMSYIKLAMIKESSYDFQEMPFCIQVSLPSGSNSAIYFMHAD